MDFVLSATGNTSGPGFKSPKVLPKKETPFTVVDIGTGSGCIPIALAKNSKNIKLVAIDTSEKALAVAKKNAEFHRVIHKIFFIENDLLKNFKQSPDIITANLPYIPTARLMHIDPMVKDFEPRLALDGGYDGFELYRGLFTQMRNQQIKPRLFIGEIDEDHRDVALVEAKRYFSDAKSEIMQDLAKKDRFIVITF